MSSHDDRLPRPIEQRLFEVVATFRKRFGRAPEAVAQAPGRVNLIGEHLDYNDGLVLPAAIDRSVLVAFGRRGDGDVRVYAVDFDEESTLRLGDQLRHVEDEGWITYARGVCRVLTEACGGGSGVDLAIASDVPLGAGLSSSAALEVAIGGALRAAWTLDLGDQKLALLCQRAENEFVGVQCGVMDQLASALGRADHAMLIDCRTLEYDYVPLPLRDGGVALAIVDSGQRRPLERSDYNRRREECVEALRLLRRAVKERPPAALRDVGMDDLERASLPEALHKRARHVMTEQCRVELSVDALRVDDIQRFGALMNESHASLRDDFEVSTPELDRLVELAHQQPGVFGARLTGAGFGGCTVNLVREEAVDAFAVEVADRFVSEARLPARMLICHPADGLRVHRAE